MYGHWLLTDNLIYHFWWKQPEVVEKLVALRDDIPKKDAKDVSILDIIWLIAPSVCSKAPVFLIVPHVCS